MTKRYLKFFYYYLLTIFLFCTCYFIFAKTINHFVTTTTHKIKICSIQELKKEWLAKQSKLCIQNINVKSRNDIPKIMELLGINGVSISSPNPSYNSNYSECIIWNLKNPQDGLLDVYFKPRPNPFKITYPYSHNEYTLDELLTHKIAIEKAYVFWDISKAKIDHNVNIHTINLNYDANTTKEAALKKYLTETIKTNDRYVELGCYNAASNEAIIVPFNSNRYFYHNNNKIEAIYFDDGVRIFTNCDKTDDLTKHANGAKNIYLFNFTLVKITREIDIPLGTTWDKRQTTESWIRNNISDEIVSRDYDYGNCFVRTTNNYYNTLYKIRCEQQKQTIYDTISLGPVDDKRAATLNWINNNMPGYNKWNNGNWGYCTSTSENSSYYYNYTITCSQKEKSIIPIELSPSDDPYESIRNWKKANNLFNNPQVIAKSDYTWEIKGDDFVLMHTVETKNAIYHINCPSTYKEKLDQWKNQCDIKPYESYSAQQIRDKFGRTCNVIYDEHGRSIYYRYDEGYIYDDWYIDNVECSGSTNRYNYHLNTTKPPKKPIEINNKSINKPVVNKLSLEEFLIIIGSLHKDFWDNDHIREIMMRRYNNDNNNNETLIVKQPEINDEKIVGTVSNKFKNKNLS